MEKSPHFFKVILPSTLAEKKLGIPEMFVKKFGNELPDIATLEVPNGQNSAFQVLIFDSTACEIHYPYNAMETNPECNAANSKLKPGNKCKMVKRAEINESDYENEHKFLALLEEMGIYITIKCSFLSKEDKQTAIHFARLLKPRNTSFMVICGSFLLTKGWCRVIKEENLKQGDICVFELIKMKDFILKLSVYHAAATLI
ncbi:hypothetical protein Patl1_35973 [Pistacia atlantica]|nr:hypothetical protein Patl1_35973 [Pistacia atlantica]